MARTSTQLDSWQYIAIIRDPIDRFLSGFVHKCVRYEQLIQWPNNFLTKLLRSQRHYSVFTSVAQFCLKLDLFRDKESCYECQSNMTCFVDALFKRSADFAAGRLLDYDEKDMHFYPQNW